MPAIEFDPLDVEQGFNFKRDMQSPVGHLLALTIGDKEMTADFKDIIIPTMSAKEEYAKCVAILGSLTWGGGYGDPIMIKAFVSTPAKQDLQALLHKDLNNTEIKFGFKIYDYDPMKKKYFEAFYPEKGFDPLQGLILKDGNKLTLEVSKTPNDSVKSPMNWEITLGIMPAPTRQGIGYATKDGSPVAKKWGVTLTTATA